MRRALLAAAAVLALAGPAAAQRIVHDPRHMAETIARGAAELRQLQQQYRQMVATYESLTGARGLDVVTSAMRGLSRTYMPGAAEVPDLAYGRGAYGRSGVLMQRNRLYMPGERDEWAEEMERRETATANAQALSAAALEDAEDRISRLDALGAALEGAQDLREVAAIQGAIAVEQQNLAAHRMQLEQVRMLLAAEERVERQRSEQRIRRDADDWIEKTREALGGW